MAMRSTGKTFSLYAIRCPKQQTVFAERTLNLNCIGKPFFTF